MGLKLSCDRCGRFMKVVTTDELRDALKDEPICKVCESIEADIHRKIATLRQKAEVEFNRVSDKYKSMLSDEIRKAVGDKYGDTD